MIAMALANEPELLIADEPTTALDVTVQKQILELLDNLRKQQHLALLFITHDLSLVKKHCDEVHVMQGGRVVEQGETAQVFDAPQHKYTQMLLDSRPKGRSTGPRPDAPTLLEANDIKVWFPIKRGVLRRTVGHIKAVDGVSLTINEVSGNTFGLNIIPHTAEVTTMGTYDVGTAVNIEVDLLARYIERMLGVESGGLSIDFLREHGYA